MRVEVDQPREDELPRDLQDRVAGRGQPRAHLGHEPVAHADVESAGEAGAGIEDVSALEQEAQGQLASRARANAPPSKEPVGRSGFTPRRGRRDGRRSSTGGASRRRTPAVSSTSDRKSTRLNSSHLVISYAVFCLKKKKA